MLSARQYRPLVKVAAFLLAFARHELYRHFLFSARIVIVNSKRESCCLIRDKTIRYRCSVPEKELYLSPSRFVQLSMRLNGRHLTFQARSKLRELLLSRLRPRYPAFGASLSACSLYATRS